MFGLSDNTIEEITGVFRQHPEIDKVLIFGSRAKGCYREGSDIDLALFGDKINRRILLKISCDIDDLEMLYIPPINRPVSSLAPPTPRLTP